MARSHRAHYMSLCSVVRSSAGKELRRLCSKMVHRRSLEEKIRFLLLNVHDLMCSESCVTDPFAIQRYQKFSTPEGNQTPASTIMKQAPYQLSRRGRYTQVFVFPICDRGLERGPGLLCIPTPLTAFAFVA